MSKPLWQVREFHEAFGLPVQQEPGFPESERRELRRNLELEEFSELCEAEQDNNLVGVADALADLLYVLYGHALEYGIPIVAVFNEVHRANMSKLDRDGKPIRRYDGKICKSEKYEPPDILPILEMYGYKSGDQSQRGEGAGSSATADLLQSPAAGNQ